MMYLPELPRPGRRRRTGLLGALAFAALAFLGLLAARGFAPDLVRGAGPNDLSGSTLTSVVRGLGAGTYGTGGTFTGHFDENGYDGFTFRSGTWNYDSATKVFSVLGSGAFGTDGPAFDVVVYADGSAAKPALALAFARRGELTLGDALPILEGHLAGSATSRAFGFVTTDGGPVSIRPGSLSTDATSVLRDALAISSEPTTIGVAVPGTVELHARVTPGGIATLLGGESADAPTLSGSAADSFAAFARVQGGTLGDTPMSLRLDLPASVPTGALDGLFEPVAGTPDWALTITTAGDGEVAVKATGPKWKMTLPFVGSTSAVFTPALDFTEPLEGGLGTATLTGQLTDIAIGTATADITITLSQQGTAVSATAAGTLHLVHDVDPAKRFDVSATGVFVNGDDGWSLQMEANVPKVSVADIATWTGTPLDSAKPPTVPPALLGVGLSNGTVGIDVSASHVAIGLTGVVDTAFPGGKGSRIGGSFMVSFNLKGSPSVVVGVSPSLRPAAGAGPIRLSELLNVTPPADQDIVIYDPKHADAGVGVVFSTAKNDLRVGGEACLETPGEGVPCPAEQKRTDVARNVARWLMPMWGQDPTDSSSFRSGGAPEESFIVTSGLRLAGSIVLPAPIGTDQAAAETACASDRATEACRKALGLLGGLGLDSRVSVSGSLPVFAGATSALEFKLGVRLIDAKFSDRPEWLADGAMSISVQLSKDSATLAAEGRLLVAVKQGYSPTQAAAMFGDGSELAKRNTLAAATPSTVCPRNGIALAQQADADGFVAGTRYCHDLLQVTLRGEITAAATDVSLSLVGDLTSEKLTDPTKAAVLANTSPNPSGWSPMGLDKFALNQITVTLGFQANATGFSLNLGAALSATIKTSPPIAFSGAISLLIRPEGLAVEGLRVNVSQISMANMVEIYEWISGQDVPASDVPGVSLRNVSFSIGTRDVKPVCIAAGFRLSGDLYVTSEPAPSKDTAFNCDIVTGTLTPAPDAPCGPAEIKAGCSAGIRLLVSDKGLLGDAFVAAFDAGPVHMFDPKGDSGRGVSLHLEVSQKGVDLDMYGGAALGGTAGSSSCSLGKFCDAWATGDFNARIKADLNGVNVKLFGRVHSGIPFLSFELLAAGKANLSGASAVIDLFRNGKLPDANFALHVELANRQAAPDLDFATAAKNSVDAQFGTALQKLSDTAKIVRLLQVNPAAAKQLLSKYSDNAEIRNLIATVDSIMSGAAEANQRTDLKWLLDGLYVGVPGIPNIDDAVRGINPPRCDGANWGYGVVGFIFRQPTATSYPDNFCFLSKPTLVPGLCAASGLPQGCQFSDVAAKLVVTPMLKIISAGIDASSSLVTFAKQATDAILSGDLFRIDCASFDAGAQLGGSLSSPTAKGTLKLGLFLTVFGKPWGASFGWTIDPTDKNNFDKNIKSLFDSVSQSNAGTTPSTCWTPQQLAEFFGDTLVSTPPASAAPLLTSAVVRSAAGDNTVAEGAPATLEMNFDRPLETPRTIKIAWTATATDTVTVPAKVQTFSASHVFSDDTPSGTASDLFTVQVTDTSSDRSLKVPVTVTNTAPSNVSLVFDKTSIKEGEQVGLTVKFVDPGVLDVHVVTVDWGDGTLTTVPPGSPFGTRSINIGNHRYAQNPVGNIAKVVVTVTDDDSGVGTAGADITVVDVAPVLGPPTLSATTVNEGGTVTLAFGILDPGVKDVFAVSIDWDSTRAGSIPEQFVVKDRAIYRDNSGVGTPLQIAGVAVVSHTYADDTPTGTASDISRIKVTLLDARETAARVEATVDVIVKDVAPTLTLSPSTPLLAVVTKVWATAVVGDVVGDPVTLTTTVNNGALPVGVSWKLKQCVPLTVLGSLIPTSSQACTYELSGSVPPKGNTRVSVTAVDDDGLRTTAATTVTV